MILRLIDTHVHLFPDPIAHRTISKLAADSRSKPATDGTLAGTLAFLEREGVDLGVVLPIATKPSQQTTINNFARKIHTEHAGRLISFGSVHPEAPDAIAELRRIKELGLPGVKLHPDYQGFYFDEERHFPVYEEMERLGLLLALHAGYDPVSPDDIHAPARSVEHVARTFPHLTIIAAHLGGLWSVEEARHCLAGMENVYLDTAMAYYMYQDPAVLEGIIRLHGVERVLFATDCPWSSVQEERGLLERTGLSKGEKERIYARNAAALLGLAG